MRYSTYVFTPNEIRSNLTSNVLFSFMGGNQNHQSRKSLYFLDGGALHISDFLPIETVKPTNSKCLLENGALKGRPNPYGAETPVGFPDVPHHLVECDQKTWGGDCAWPNPQRESSLPFCRPIGLCEVVNHPNSLRRSFFYFEQRVECQKFCLFCCVFLLLQVFILSSALAMRK